MKDEAVTAVKITGYAENPIATIDGHKVYLIEFSKSDNDDYGYTSLSEVKKAMKLIEN